MDIVCIDSHVLIWGIKEEASPGQEHMVARAKSFLRHLDKSNTQIMIPAPIVAEFLMRVPPEMHTTVNNLLQRDFMLPPFDAHAAAHFSRIWQAKKDAGTVKKLQQDGRTRNELKADSMIVAIAVARGAKCIYSNDSDLRRFAEGFIEVRDIPEVLEQLPLKNNAS